MPEISTVLNKVTEALADVAGVEAIVLGGSRARGTALPDSDIDIGIYYESEALDLSALREAARLTDDEHRDELIAPPGAWGRWVNGGGWLVVDGYHVDFILRDIRRVQGVIQDCREGIVTPHYQTGHPHAYISAMYMGELAISKLLWDRGNVAALKHSAEDYPPKLQQALCGMFGFEAGFSAMLAESSAAKDDIYYVAAHVTRSISALNQVLFALNKEYCINEKKAVRMIEGFPLHPEGYKDKIDAIFSELGTAPEAACALLQSLVDEATALIPK